MIDIQHYTPDSMSQPDLYEALDQNLKNSSFDGSAAQAHGIASGLVCRDLKTTELDSDIAHLNFSDDTSITALESLVEMAARDLNQAEFGFDLWLPETDELDILLNALADWSQGFVIGLMYDGSDILSQLSGELNDSIKDVIEVAGLEAGNASTTDDEMALFEIREYLRMTTQLIYEELNPDRPIVSDHE